MDLMINNSKTISELKLKAFAKVNLYFNIVGTQKFNGIKMHLIETVFYALPNLYDIIDFDFYESDCFNISVKMDCKSRQTIKIDDKDNLIVKAANYFNDQNFSVNIRVLKNIAISGGLAGGSANAAATLYALNLKSQKFTEAQLYSIAAQIGADVPFSLFTIIEYYQNYASNINSESQSEFNIAAVGTHFGDKLQKINIKEGFKLSFDIRTFDYGVSTVKAYQTFDLLNSSKSQNAANNNCHFLIDNVVKALEIGDKKLLSASIYNCFQKMAISEKMLRDDTITSIESQNYFMTGSGPTVFNIQNV